VKYATSAAFRAALEQRLLAQARERRDPVVRLRKLVVFERLLARLLIVAPDRWVLKGALALDFRLGGRSRTTNDMDLARQDSEQAATADFIAAQSVDSDDYFTFSIERTGQLDALIDGAAVRYHIVAGLAGRLFEEAIVDVGFGEPLILGPEALSAPDLLRFADIERITVPALPLEQQIAEKVHAYTRRYGGTRGSTRVKDLVDIVLIAKLTTVEVGRLRRSLDAVFERRGSHPLPAVLSLPPFNWAVAYRKLAVEVELDPAIESGYNVAASLLDPVLGAAVAGGANWDPVVGTWVP